MAGLFWVIAVLGGCWFLLSCGSSHKNHTEKQHAKALPSAQNNDRGSVLIQEDQSNRNCWRKYKEKIKRNEKLITATSTIFIAIFTVVLGVSTVFLWNATRDLVNDAKQNAERQLRAYVLYSNNAIELLPDGMNYLVSMSIKNRGQTPAYSVTYWWDSGIFDIETGPRHVYEKPIRETGQISFDLDPTGEWPIEQLPKAISQSDIQAIRNGTKAIYVWGIIKYRDAFPGRDTFQRCQFVNFLVKNGREFTVGKSRFDAIEVNNTIEEPCIIGENKALKSGFTNTP